MTGPKAPMRTRRVSVGGKPFSARNPTTIGAIGLVVLLGLLYAAFNASSLPIIGGGTHYTAYFREDAGLRSNDDVRIAGVVVGKVTSTSLDGDRVKVVFRVKHAFIGDQSTADIKLKTLLGAKYLAIDSTGSRAQDPSTAIPLSRTSVPFDVYPAFTGLTKKIDAIDTGQLATAFSTLSTDFRGTPSSVSSVLTGLSRLSNTIASRDQSLRDLLARADQVTGVLADRDTQLQKLFSDGSLLLDELNRRAAEIDQLFVNTSTLSLQLEGLVKDNQKTLGPLLASVKTVLGTLEQNRDDLEQGLALLGPFYRVFNNVIGNGRWFDNYICNFSVVGVLQLPIQTSDSCT